MTLIKTGSLAIEALRRNVGRSALTVLGIVIGIAAVIAMMEIGKGSSTSIAATIASMGANNLLVMPGTATSGGVSFGAGSILTLTSEDCDAILKECPAVEAASPIVRARTQIIYGNENWVPQYIYGITPAYQDVRDWTRMAEGDALGPADIRNVSRVCMVGQTLVHQLFHDQSPLGKEIRIQSENFKVIGVLSAKGANAFGMDQDDIVLAPWTTIKYRIVGGSGAGSGAAAGGNAAATSTSNTVFPGTLSVSLFPIPSASQLADQPTPVRFANVDQILLSARSADAIPSAVAQLKDLLRERHRIRPGQNDDFAIRDMTESANALASTTNLMTKLLLAVALISLVVGGVGIMNIMLVSVTERTREIGLRMAVGATPVDILRQFLAEALLLCVIGGLVGLALGRGTSLLVREFLHWPVEASIEAVVAAIVVSAAVGVGFGFYPAWKASMLDPIDALRYE